MIRRTILYDFPVGCKGYSCKDPYSGDSVVVLNAKYNHEANVNTYLHESEHEVHDDVDSPRGIGEIECIRHLKKHASF